VFGFENVSQLAKKAADQAFHAPPSIPDFLKTISYDEYRDIRFDVKRNPYGKTGGTFSCNLFTPALFLAMLCN